MCPTSNRQTKAVSNMNEYPLSYYLSLGLCVTINTDDMAIEGTTLKMSLIILKSNTIFLMNKNCNS